MKKSLDYIWQTSLRLNQCPYGCDLQSVPCAHLEEYIAISDSKADYPAKLISVPDVDHIPVKFLAPSDSDGYYIPKDTEVSTQALVDKLIEFGLEEYEIDIILDRCIDNLTFSEIAEKHGYTSKGMAYRHYRIVVKKLKEGRFGKK